MADLPSTVKAFAGIIPEEFLDNLSGQCAKHPSRLAVQDMLEGFQFLGDTGDLSVMICCGPIPYFEIGIDDNSRAMFGDPRKREKIFKESIASKTPSILISYGKETGNEFVYTGRRNLVYWYCRLVGQSQLRRLLLHQSSNAQLSSVPFFEVLKDVERLFGEENSIVSVQSLSEKEKISYLLDTGDRKLTGSDMAGTKRFVDRFLRK
jgi:hypothetical protein